MSACGDLSVHGRLARWGAAPVAEGGDGVEFVARLRAGDRAAFETLVRRHQHRVYGVALRMLGDPAEAEDVAQEVFLRAHRALPGFRGDARVSTWLHAITARLCLTRLGGGARRRRQHGGEALLAGAVDPAPGPDRTLERDELEEALQRAIAGLPEERWIVVVLRDVEGLDYQEIAEALGIPIGTVRSRLHRARLDLKEKLERFLP